MPRHQKKQSMVIEMANPNCPEPKCHRILRLRHLKTDLGLMPCPFCKSEYSKGYVLTPKKEGLRKCMKCRKDFPAIRREGYSRFFICRDHPWQKFQVGCEIIRCKNRPVNWKQLQKELGVKRPFQATQRKQQMPPNMQMIQRPRRQRR